jgi:hypothetical protein
VFKKHWNGDIIIGHSMGVRIAGPNISPNTTAGIGPEYIDVTANSIVRTLDIDNQGNIVIGGDFTTVGATARNYIARISSEGILDSTFNPSAGDSVNSIVIQPDGNILVGGNFTGIGSTNASYIARLSNNGLTNFAATNVGVEVGAIYYVSNNLVLVGAGTRLTVLGSSRFSPINSPSFLAKSKSITLQKFQTEWYLTSS